MSDADTCPRCDGCGKMWGDADNEVPFSEVSKLPYRDVALSMQLTQPRACPDCLGTGHIPEPGAWEKLSHHVGACECCASKSLNDAADYCKTGRRLFSLWLATVERRKQALAKGATDGNV